MIDGNSYSKNCILCTLPELLVKSNKSETISHPVSILDPLYSLFTACFTNVNGLDPAFDLLRTRQLQHGQHFRSISDMARADITAIASEVLHLQFWQCMIGHANVMKFAHNLEDAEILCQVEMLDKVGSVDEEIEGKLIRLMPVLFIAVDEVLGTQFEGIILLVWTMGDDSYFSA
jgi:hypothetical protein